MNKLMKKILTACAILVIVIPAYALDLKGAKQQGLVGEMSNGYLGAVVQNAETSALVKEVNAKRKAFYLKLAKKNKITLEQVAVLAGKKAIQKTSAGGYIKLDNGSWQKK